MTHATLHWDRTVGGKRTILKDIPEVIEIGSEAGQCADLLSILCMVGHGRSRCAKMATVQKGKRSRVRESRC